MYELYIKPVRYYRKAKYYKNNYEKDLRAKTFSEIARFTDNVTKKYLKNHHYNKNIKLQIRNLINKMVYKWLCIELKFQISPNNKKNLNKYKCLKISHCISNTTHQNFIYWLINQEYFYAILLDIILLNTHKNFFIGGDDYEVV